MNKCHDGQQQLVQSMRKERPAIVPVQDLPWDKRSWTCSKCRKGLPYMPNNYQKILSAEAHLKKCQPKATKLQNFTKLRSRKGPKEVRQTLRNKQGWHVPEWREKRLAQARAKGHDVVHIGVPADKGLLKDSVIKFACTKCKKLQQNNHGFTLTACQPRSMPRSVGWVSMRMRQDFSLKRGVGVRSK